MPTFSSKQLIDSLQEQTATILHTAQENWNLLPQQQMLYKPFAESWSATQCLLHLNAYAQYYLPHIQCSISAAEQKKWQAADQFTSGIIGNWFTNLMLPKKGSQDIRKMKAPKKYSPIQNDNSDAVLQAFISQQTTLLSLLTAARQVNLQKAKTPVFIIPFIKLRLGDTLRFIVAHNQRHVWQAERAIHASMQQTKLSLT